MEDSQNTYIKKDFYPEYLLDNDNEFLQDAKMSENPREKNQGQNRNFTKEGAQVTKELNYITQ